ncbi:MAG: hypothetical protein ACJ74K_01115, partial [Actinomycetes bacterium]
MDNRSAQAQDIHRGTPPATTRAPAPTPAVDRLCLVTAAVLIVSGLAHLLVFAVDGGPWYGPVSWRKPVTFG